MFLIAQTETSTTGDLLGFFLPAALILIAIAAIVFVQLRKANIVAGQQDDLRQLVHRYEQLAENILDVQQRVAADIADMRARTASVEQILRTVE
jgi:hypothetical protein